MTRRNIMVFAISRISLLCLIFIVCFVLIRKSNIAHKRSWYFLSFALSIAVVTLSTLFPIENAFVRFPSVESAYGYLNTEEAQLVVEGKDTAFVVWQNDINYDYLIIPKAEDGWKIGSGSDTKQISQTIVDGIVIYVYRYRDSEDYYITVLDTKGGTSVVKDNQNSEFFCLKKANTALNEIYCTYYAYVADLSDSYSVTVNGETIVLNEESIK